MKIRTLTTLLAVGASALAASAVTIDGIIDTNEWTGAATYTIGNGGGMAYFKADTSFVYGAFDITGWTSAMGAASGGNLLGFGVWGTNGGYGGTGVEFQQSTTSAAWGNDGNSGTMNGLVSAFRINAQTPPAASIPGSLQAMDSFATGHRVWEVMMPISTMGVIAGDTIWAVGGINYDKAQHWYPTTFGPPLWGSYAPIPVEAAPSVPDGGLTLVLLGSALTGLVALRRKFIA
jgi:hypothetical protein